MRPNADQRLFIGIGVIVALIALSILWASIPLPELFGQMPVGSGAPLILVDGDEHYAAGAYLQFLEDDSRSFTINQVTSEQMSPRWQTNRASVPNFGFTQSAIWLRLRVENKTSTHLAWVLELAHPYLEEVDFYGPYSPTGAPTSDTVVLNQSHAIEQQPFQYLTFPLQPQKNGEQVYYLRLVSSSNVRAPLFVWSERALSHVHMLRALFWGGVLSFALLFGLYRLIQFLLVKESSYLYLALYCFSVAIIFFSEGMSPYLVQVLRFTDPWRLGIFFSVVYWISLLLFTDSFLELQRVDQRSHRAVQVCVLLLSPLMPVAIFAGIRLNLILTYLISIPMSIIFLMISIKALKINRNARYLVVALAIPFVATSLQASLRLGGARFDLPVDLVTVTGNLIMIMLLSLSQGERIIQLQVSLKSANQALRDSEKSLYQYLQAIPLGVSVYDTQMMLKFINPAVLRILGREMPEYSDYETMNLPYQIVRSKTGEPYPLEELPIMRVMRTGESCIGDDLVLIDGEQRREIQVWSSPLFDADGKLNATINIFADISEQRAMQAKLQMMVDERILREQRQRRIAESMQRTAITLSSQMNLPGMLAEILDRLNEVVPFSKAAIYVYDGEALIIGAEKGRRQVESQAEERLLSADHPVKRVFAERRVVVLPESDSVSTLIEPDVKISQPNWIGTPLLTAGDAVGVLEVENPTIVEETSQLLSTLDAFASHAGIAVANARLLRQAGAAATMEERNRLARDLHDAVTQTLFSVSLIAEALPASWEKNPEAVLPYLQKLNRLARSALAEMRNLLLELRPSALIEAPFEQLLANLKDAYSGKLNIPLQYDTHDACGHELPSEIKIAFYRIAQEALNNLIKHANAQNALIRFYFEDCGAVLIIRDDGRGFIPDQQPSGRMGLSTMRERAEAIGAELEIRSQPGMGTTVTLSWEPGK